MIEYRQPFAGTYPITQNFGEVIDGVTHNGKPHTGIDYGCPMNTPILASADGKVIRADFEQNGYGNYIIIQHADGSGTVYAHLYHMLVLKNQIVKQGEQIALSGSTGDSTGPHLHFEIRTDAEKITTVVDPRMYLKSFFESDPNNSPATVNPQFEPVSGGFVMVVCDVANVRCHCDMSRVMKQLHKMDVISIGSDVTWYNGLPYRDYFDPDVNCWLRIAEHDPDTQILANYVVDPNRKSWDTVHYL